MKETIILSLGGSLIVPNGGIDTEYLNQFKEIILNETQDRRFFIVTGGGATARHYQEAAKKIGELTRDDLDWLGIHSSRLNAHLLRTIFREQDHPRIITTPTEKETVVEDLVIAAGYRPGRSTDWVATQLANEYKATTVINLSNITYVYDKDPKKFSDAKLFKNISWEDFRKIVGDKWDPGLNLPFDPIAAKLAQKIKLRVNILNGKNLINFKNCLNGKNFEGTIITSSMT